MTQAIRLLVAVVVSLTMAMMVAVVLVQPLRHPFTGPQGLLAMAFWIGLTLVASASPIRLPSGPAVSVSSTPILAAGFLGGPAVAAIVAAIGTIEAREVRGGVPWYGTLYNHAVLVASAIVATVLFEALSGASGAQGPSTRLAAALVAGVAYLLVNELLSGAAIALRENRKLPSVVRSDLASYGMAFLGLVPLAWLMAVTYELVGPLVALVFALPLYTTRAAYQSVVELRRMFTQTVRALASAIDARDPSTRRHSEHVSGIAVEIGREMGVGEADLEILEWGGLFHDIGKIGISDAILLKPGRLDREERIEMNRHPAKGAEILANADRLRAVVPLVRFHHEWYNGSGYPDRLIGDEIPLLARILAVADAFEAMTAVRPYQPRPKTLEQAIDELHRCSGTQFDPRVVDAFVRTRTARGLGEVAADPTRLPGAGSPSDRPPLLPQNRPQTP